MKQQVYICYISFAIIACIHTVNCEENEWVDSLGRMCDVYVSEGMCYQGSYGPRWRYDVQGHFQDYADEAGIDAGDRCCECIPSTSAKFITLGCPNRNEPESIWHDSSGLTCHFYRNQGWCKYFGYGKFIDFLYFFFICGQEAGGTFKKKWNSII